MSIHVLYLAHDLADAAIRRRVLTLKAGGAEVTVAGFTRGRNLLEDEAGVQANVLGTTSDGKFTQRIGAVAKASLDIKGRLAGVRKPDVIIARNLETLALAGRAAAVFDRQLPVVYECLDIHRLLTDEGWKGRLMRGFQRHFGRRAQLLITSSPAFIENFFKPRSGLDLPVMLMENKVLALGPDSVPAERMPRAPVAGEPWKIGWFGAIRCAKSLSILTEFARRMDGKVEIVLRGRPAYGEFDDFARIVAEAPHVAFHGSYRNPEDLSRIYDEVQFNWAIDFFEEGLNSEWLLPNRLYEGGLYGAVPIALKSTETGRFLARRDIGLTIDKATPDALEALFNEMTIDRYSQQFSRIAAVERSQWVTGPADCRALVAKLAALKPDLRSPAEMQAASTLQS
ncbi:glycosyltransferase [Neorhizobium sp. NCHU2750]|uniref:glycosyltransferase n=1 Tax=Neorhizobium sp. NCHU2750 TaxID=1825976 RepID=UPI000E70E9D8|nr:succinoglycan biosynthesis protein [Neorhizobium sp. NCHU2750]